MITCTRRIEWDAAHRVLRHESKCATLHGHRYRADITCAATDLDEVGRVVDFGVIKRKVGGWVDEMWDHTTLCNPDDESLILWCEEQRRLSAESDGPTLKPPYVMGATALATEPTAENIARELLGAATLLLRGDRIWVTSVVVWETPNCWSEAKVG